MSTTTTTPAPLNVKLTKTAAIGLLSTISTVIAVYAKANPGLTVWAFIVGAALGDGITFLMGSTLSDKWVYTSVNVLLSAILSIVGVFIGQLVGGGLATPMIGAIAGYLLAYVITLLDSGAPTTTTPAPSPPATTTTTTTPGAYTITGTQWFMFTETEA